MAENSQTERAVIVDTAVVALTGKPVRRWVAGGVTALLVVTGGGLAWWQLWTPSFQPASMERMTLELPHTVAIDKPSVANISSDINQERFSDDITEDLMTSVGADVRASATLHTAAISGDFDIVQLLLANGADVNVKTVGGSYPGQTPLHATAYAGHIEIAELLLAYGADVYATDRYGYTPLRRTVDQGHLVMAEWFINKGASIASRDTSGLTLLHVVARTDHFAIAELLITKGADVNAMDSFGFTPLDYAQGGEKKMVEMLERHGAICTIC